MKTHKYHIKFHQSNRFFFFFSKNMKYPSHTSKEIISLIKKEKTCMYSDWINDKMNLGSQMMI